MATAGSTDRTLRRIEPLASSPPETSGETPPATEPLSSVERLPAFIGRARGQLVRLSFWTAVFLPVLYVPLLLAGTGTTQELLLGLIGAHVVALLGGRSYHGSIPQ